MGQAAPLVAVERVAKRFGVVQALKGVSLEVRAGEVLALVGENGAGKSTLMRLLEGVFEPDSGRILVDGAPVRFRGPAEAHAAGIRVIHQEPEIVPELTVAENIFLGDIHARAGLFLDWRDLEGRTRALLEAFGVARELPPRRSCRGLGPAQRQLIEIMRALKGGGRLVAFDEPTSSLTAEEARRLFSIIAKLRADGVAVVYISHRLAEVFVLADRVAVLRDGELVALRPKEALDEAEVVRLMVGRDLGGLFRRRTAPAGEPVLEVEDLSTDKVKNCSIVVRAGEVVGLGGLIGAGRSELARGIFGFDRRRQGTVSVAGARYAPTARATRSWPASASRPRTGRKRRCCWRAACSTTSRCACRTRSAASGSSIAAGRRPSPGRSPIGCGSAPPASTTWSPSSPAATSRRWCSAAGWHAAPRS